MYFCQNACHFKPFTPICICGIRNSVCRNSRRVSALNMCLTAKNSITKWTMNFSHASVVHSFVCAPLYCIQLYNKSANNNIESRKHMQCRNEIHEPKNQIMFSVVVGIVEYIYFTGKYGLCVAAACWYGQIKNSTIISFLKHFSDHLCHNSISSLSNNRLRMDKPKNAIQTKRNRKQFQHFLSSMICFYFNLICPWIPHTSHQKICIWFVIDETMAIDWFQMEFEISSWNVCILFRN